MNKSSRFLFAVLLAFEGFILASCAVVPEADFLAAQEMVDQLSNELEALQDELTVISSQLSETRSDLKDANSKLSEAQNQVIELTQANEELSAKIDELENSNAELKTQVSELNTENRQYTNELSFYKCDETLPDMKYDSILQASEILSGWTECVNDLRQLNSEFTL